MKKLLLISALAIAGGAVLPTQGQEEPVKHKKHAKDKMHEHKKHAHKKDHEHNAKDKKHHYTKSHAKQAPTTVKQYTPRTQATPVAQTGTTKAGWSKWLGLGGATAASAVTTKAVAGEVHHRGPAEFFEKHNFPANWTYGWVGKWVNGQWLFAGYDLNWWKENYPAYYRDVVRPEATKAGVPVHEVTKLIKKR